MKTLYEYKLINKRRMKAKLIEQMLNDMSIKGWDFFDSHSYDIGTGVRFIFRREKIQNN